MSLGNCKLKSQDSTTHLLEWLKSKKLTTSNADKKVEQQGLSFIASGNAKRYSHFERKSGSYYRAKIVSAIKFLALIQLN